MNWLSAITAVSKLFGTLTGLYRDWGLRRAGAKEARLSASKLDRLGPNGWQKSLPIWTLLMTMNLISACGSINAPVDGCGWVKPISVAEEAVQFWRSVRSADKLDAISSPSPAMEFEP